MMTRDKVQSEHISTLLGLSKFGRQPNLPWDSHGEFAGIYLRPEARSKLKFDPVYLGPFNDMNLVCKRFNQACARLEFSAGPGGVDYYVEHSLGLDVNHRVAWCNLDKTEHVLSHCEAHL